MHKVTLKEKIQDFWEYDVAPFFRYWFWGFPEKIAHRFYKLCVYGKFIMTEDYDWDEAYIMRLLGIKLRFVEKALREGTTELCKADEVKICRDAIDRIWENDYCQAEEAQHEEKWGPWDREDDFSKPLPEPIEKTIAGKKFTLTHCIVFPQRVNVKTPEDEKIYDKEVDDMFKKKHELLKADYDLVFDTMKRCIRGWWD